LPASDYYLATQIDGKNPNRWSWEIRRHNGSLGVKLTDGGYQSRAAAELAGQRVLQKFLADLIKEEKRKR
jgi:hypothetical protein